MDSPLADAMSSPSEHFLSAADFSAFFIRRNNELRVYNVEDRGLNVPKFKGAKGQKKRYALAIRWVALLALVALTAPVRGERVIYVSAHATGANDGTCWTDAFIDLQDGVAAAQPGDEIWVAAGVYKPDRGTGNRLMSFELVSGVGVYGGFSGDETCLDERDPQANPTILSGDLLDNDDPSFVPTSNCCYPRPDELGCDDAACAEIVDANLLRGVSNCGMGRGVRTGGGVLLLRCVHRAALRQ